MQINREVKLITFLGRCGNYQKTRYCFDDGKCWEHKLTMSALIQRYKPYKIYIFSTQEGFDSCRNVLQEEKTEIPYEKILITAPKSDKEVWQLHDKLGSILENGDRVILDITHSFRHIPLVSLISLLYEMRLKGIEIVGIFYGAFESKENGKTPIIDITSALDVIRWHYGLDNFERFGNATELKSLIEDLHQEFGIKKEKTDTLRIIGDFKKIMGNIENISTAIYLNQNLDVLSNCYSLSQNLDRYKVVIDKLSDIYPPLIDIRLRVKKFVDMGYEDPWGTLNKDILVKLLLLAKYQRDIGLFGHSIETLREWLVSYVIFICGDFVDSWVERDTRFDAEKALGKFSNEKKENMESLEITHTYKCLETKLDEEEIDNIVSMWRKIVDIRNKVAHAGMTQSKIKNNKIATVLDEIIAKFNELVGGEGI